MLYQKYAEKMSQYNRNGMKLIGPDKSAPTSSTSTQSTPISCMMKYNFYNRYAMTIYRYVGSESM